MERSQVVRIRRIERDSHQRAVRVVWRVAAVGRGGFGRGGDSWRSFVKDGGVFEGTKVESSEGTVFADGDEDVCAAGEPGYVVLPEDIKTRRREREREVRKEKRGETRKAVGVGWERTTSRS